jgi:hypothetical protein
MRLPPNIMKGHNRPGREQGRFLVKMGFRKVQVSPGGLLVLNIRFHKSYFSATPNFQHSAEWLFARRRPHDISDLLAFKFLQKLVGDDS